MSAFSHPVRVRFNECDPQGIVFNANFATYVDVTLTELWRSAFGSYAQGVEVFGVDLVVAELNQRFRASAVFDDVLDIGLAIESIGTTSITTAIAITRDGSLVVEGSIRHVCVDRETFEKTPVPDAMRERLLEVAGAMNAPA